MDQKQFYTVTVMGLGYIGLPTASLLAAKGNRVYGCDINPNVVNTINAGKIHIVEPKLNQLVKQVVDEGRLSAVITPPATEIYIIAVPTPFLEDHSPDLSCIHSAAQQIAPKLQAGNLIILESTSPVGTTEKLAHWLEELRPELFKPQRQIFIAHCPERVLPGQILKELAENDRVIGGIDPPSAEMAKSLYQTFVKGKIFLTNCRTAEMSKLVENAYRDVNIAFANELSLICEDLDINVWELIKLANRHPRVNILKPGPGVGGHCIAVDPWFIVDSAQEKARLIRCAREINCTKPHYIIDKINTISQQFSPSPKIGCLGLAFKPDIDDLRESPSLFITEQLLAKNPAELLVVEPHIQELPPTLMHPQNRARLVKLDYCLENADILLLLVDHQQFKQIDLSTIKTKTIIDTRGLWHETSTH